MWHVQSSCTLVQGRGGGNNRKLPTCPPAHLTHLALSISVTLTGSSLSRSSIYHKRIWPARDATRRLAHPRIFGKWPKTRSERVSESHSNSSPGQSSGCCRRIASFDWAPSSRSTPCRRHIGKVQRCHVGGAWRTRGRPRHQLATRDPLLTA